MENTRPISTEGVDRYQKSLQNRGCAHSFNIATVPHLGHSIQRLSSAAFFQIVFKHTNGILPLLALISWKFCINVALPLDWSPIHNFSADGTEWKVGPLRSCFPECVTFALKQIVSRIIMTPTIHARRNNDTHFNTLAFSFFSGN